MLKKGHLPSIRQAAWSRLVGVLGDKKDKFCTHACEILKRHKGKKGPEVLLTLIAALIGLAGIGGFAAGLILALIWIDKKGLLEALCICLAEAAA
jgi:hypothetical protein